MLTNNSRIYITSSFNEKGEKNGNISVCALCWWLECLLIKPLNIKWVQIYSASKVRSNGYQSDIGVPICMSKDTDTEFFDLLSPIRHKKYAWIIYDNTSSILEWCVHALKSFQVYLNHIQVYFLPLIMNIYTEFRYTF